MWEQSLAFPLSGIPDVQPLAVELFDRDFRGKEFLGQVLMTLGKARNIAEHAALGESYWCDVSCSTAAAAAAALAPRPGHRAGAVAGTGAKDSGCSAGVAQRDQQPAQ